MCVETEGNFHKLLQHSILCGGVLQIIKYTEERHAGLVHSMELSAGCDYMVMTSRLKGRFSMVDQR